MHESFVDIAEFIPGIQLDIRYATSHNLTNHPLSGYQQPKALLTRHAAEALKSAYHAVRALGLNMLVYDAYRPQDAVNDFITWSKQPEDYTTKAQFYPHIPKDEMFIRGFIAEKSGHSRGSSIDLTLTLKGKPVDMGTAFDYMDEKSFQNAPDLTKQQKDNRALLRAIMVYAGFAPYECEWWHFRLMNEPFPETYFNFKIK